ncbi:MAG: hypothetical protein DI581_02360, partial [Staphylococcus capitis]
EVEAALCAPFIDLAVLLEKLQDSSVAVGAQNVYFEQAGAYTGEVSAHMLADCGVSFALVGHSERRQYFVEDDRILRTKLKSLYLFSNLGKSGSITLQSGHQSAVNSKTVLPFFNSTNCCSVSSCFTCSTLLNQILVLLFDDDLNELYILLIDV